MAQKPFGEMAPKAQNEGRRLVAPLVGFPGLNMTGCTVKLAQQNYGEHYKVVKLLAQTFQPDVIFPLVDLSVEAEVTELLRNMEPFGNFVLSTGCDLPQETPLENIHTFTRAGRRYRRPAG